MIHTVRRFARALGVAVLTAAMAVGCIGAASAEPNTDPYVPPSVTIAPPNTDDCAQRSQPPPPLDTSENVPDGAPAPVPLPVPPNPVGAGRLGECGLIVPDGAPPLPSDISAGAWVIADLDTGAVLAAKDPHGRYRPASTLKLLTAQVMLTNLTDLEQVVEATEADADQEGTRVGLEAGGKYTVRQLMTYLLIISGNDAANALARVNGGYDKTIADMNATATALGALDTRAATVSGLDGPGQTTSAYDLALFAKKDMATPPFPDLIATQDARVPSATDAGYLAANDNQLLYQYRGAMGGKTGFTDDAGNTYVGMAQQGGRRLVVTMMHGTQQPRRQWMQAASLLDWGFALPAATAPVGTLVRSLAEATAVPAAPTPSIPAPASGDASAGASAAGDAASPISSAAGSTDATPTAGSATTGGVGTGAPPVGLVAAGTAAALATAGVVIFLFRRRRSGISPPPDSVPAAVEPDAAAEELGPDEPRTAAEDHPTQPEQPGEPAR